MSFDQDFKHFRKNFLFCLSKKKKKRGKSHIQKAFKIVAPAHFFASEKAFGSTLPKISKKTSKISVKTPKINKISTGPQKFALIHQQDQRVLGFLEEIFLT